MLAFFIKKVCKIFGETKKSHYFYCIKLNAMHNSNLEIVKRLAELAKNRLEYSVYPKPAKEEYIFLANWLNDACHRAELEFSKAFGRAVGEYKSKGWFYKPEDLVWKHMRIQQMKYAIYGEQHIIEIAFNSELNKDAYRDLIEQIDRTALMTPEELKNHNDECDRIANEILDEIEKDESK